MNETEATESFLELPLPSPGWPAGYAWLIERYGLAVPTPTRLAAIAAGTPRSTERWQMLRPARRAENSLAGQLELALKYEGVDLAVLAALFDAVPPEALAEFVRATPLGVYARRAWYLYEWLTGRVLDVPDAAKVRAVPVVDPAHQFALVKGTLSRRHRVLDNLPGTPRFCPMVRRSALLDGMIARQLGMRAREVLGRTPRDVVARAAAFLLLNDSRSSFAIEGERPSRARAARWGQAIGQAGKRPLSVAELERLQAVVLGDVRTATLGLRTEGGFVGEHDRTTLEPIPDHISARPEDLASLMSGLVAYAERAVAGGVDPVVAAAVVAFGFIYVHPFEDGNGRLHRWLMHHVLAAAGYVPPGIVFPVSAAILRVLDDYRSVLESYSQPLLSLIEWEETDRHNVRVLNDTGRYYRFFDATRHAEFLYQCVEQTVTVDLPAETGYVQGYDRFAERVKNIVEMPDRTVALLRDFLAQHDGRLSVRACEREFAALTPEAVEEIEAIYRETLGMLPAPR